MKRQPTRSKTIVGVLADADPRFVSLVDHGANQRPFHTVKRDQSKETHGMPKQPEFKIHRVVFDPEHFATEDAVKAFLTSKGYTDFTVAKNDNGKFYVEDTPADQFVGDLREVPHSAAKGVTYVAGDALEPEGEEANKSEGGKAPGTEASEKGAGETSAQKADEVDAGAPGAEGAEAAKGADKTGQASAAKAEDAPQPRTRTRRGLIVAGKSLSAVVASHEELAEKLDGGEVTTAKSFAEMLSCYNGSMPPGVYDMADAMVGAMRKMFSDGEVDEAKVSKLASDFASGVMGLYEVYANVMANKAAGEAEVADALLAMLFDAMVTEKGHDAAHKAATDATMGELLNGMKAMQAQMDALRIQQIEKAAAGDEGEGEGKQPADKAAAPGRTVKSRNSTDGDEAGEAAKAADEKEQAETQKRVAARMFGRHATKGL